MQFISVRGATVNGSSTIRSERVYQFYHCRDATRCGANKIDRVGYLLAFLHEISAKYSSLKLELLALKWAITKKFRGYLLGHRFAAYTDNNPLAHLETPKFGAVEQRWIAEIGPFDFTIHYKPGRNNQNADALSRNPVGPAPDTDEEYVAVTAISATFVAPSKSTDVPPEISISAVNFQLGETQPPPLSVALDVSELRRQQHADEDLAKIRPFVESSTVPPKATRKTWPDSDKP
ncbi:Pol polyprotein [Elysia marginata]|uniref:Pol polyprotein n=1 Tax=Elysia marginata TaxID=1093978 RepID=A0AAV4GN03_9GAST|nr:Pol polyprotein [Elysia marginata]